MHDWGARQKRLHYPWRFFDAFDFPVYEVYHQRPSPEYAFAVEDNLRTREQRVLLGVLLVGGIAVLASYVQGYLSHPEVRWEIWGGIPIEMRPVYTVSMVLAALGYFPMTTFFLLRVDPGTFRVAGRFGFSLITLSYVVVMAGSAAWMPLTYAMIGSPTAGLWVIVRIVLVAVAAGSLGLLFALLAGTEKTPKHWHRLAVLGCVFFCWQTMVLDALIWTYYYPF